MAMCGRIDEDIHQGSGAPHLPQMPPNTNKGKGKALAQPMKNDDEEQEPPPEQRQNNEPKEQMEQMYQHMK